METIRNFSSSLFIILALLFVSCKENSSPVCPAVCKSEYQEYTAILNQSGTNDPTVIIVTNSMDSVVNPVRFGYGSYALCVIKGFPISKTTAIISNGGNVGSVYCDAGDSEHMIRIYSKDGNGNYSDNIIHNCTINIKVYR